MVTTLAFDVYGTLIDTHGVVTLLEELVGDKAKEFSRTWRDKQLEYSFRKGLMQNYETFAVCTSQALDYTCALLDDKRGGRNAITLSFIAPPFGRGGAVCCDHIV